MRLIQALREIFFFPFYFVSLNVAGFLSFVKFVQGSPPMWEKGDRVVQIVCPAVEEAAEEKEHVYVEGYEHEEGYEDDHVDYSHFKIFIQPSGGEPTNRSLSQ
ncbi:MAG: hypothetical protein AB1847_18500 [bacterium]